MRNVVLALLFAGAMIAVAILATGCATDPPVELDPDLGRALICVSLPPAQQPDFCQEQESD